MERHRGLNEGKTPEGEQDFDSCFDENIKKCLVQYRPRFLLCNV